MIQASKLSSLSEHKKFRLDKRLFLSFVLLFSIAIYFWTSSRYPALDEKAALGGDNDIAALAFDQIVKVSSSDSMLQQIFGNALNWAYTNKQGMLFGVLFATAIMTLLQLLSNKQFKGRFANTLLGVSIGAPLGVCANCAVPIAMGTQRSGARTETTLAILMSSPTLNMVVLGMTFSIFPFWLASLKIAMSLAFILIAIPLAVRWFGPDQAPHEDEIDLVMGGVRAMPPVTSLGSDSYFASDIDQAPNWRDAFVWLSREVAKNLWYIIKLTVPLMILAGILGAIAVTLVPWDVLANLIPTSGVAWLIGLVLVSILGVFLPVPIAFDVVICAVLLAVGVDPAYVGTLLVTLGLFSIYPGLQIWHSISRPLAIGLFGMVAMLGLVTGLTANGLSAWETQRQGVALEDGLAIIAAETPAPNNLQQPIRNTIGTLETVDGGMLVPIAQNSVEVRAWPFETSTQKPVSDSKIFIFDYGNTLGINEPDNISPNRFMVPVERNRSIATGDVHGDGWPDLVFTSEAGLALYANLAGQKFSRQEISAPEIENNYIMRAALVDIDGDEDLDIIVGTYSDGVFSIENQNGQFQGGAVQIFKGLKGTATSALAFGDIDRDGDLDMIIGNSAIGNNSIDRSVTAARNVLLMRDNGRWHERPLMGPDGETLSILLTDLNADDWLDIFVGNDYKPQDQLWLSDGNGGFQAAPSDLIPGGTGRWTMSLASADIDGDLIPEVYSGNISGRAKARPRDPEAECRYETGAEKEKCVQYLLAVAPYHEARRRSDAIGCQSISDPYHLQGCTLVALTAPTMTNGGTGAKAVGDLCEKIPTGWEIFQTLCEVRRSEELAPLSVEELRDTLKSGHNTNVFLKKGASSDTYLDAAEGWGIDDGGWTWNARFADLNHDGLQDLYIVNGHSIARKRYEHKLFINKSGHFEDEAEAAGLASGVATTSYSFADLDRDGDLDIITVPLVGPVKVYRSVMSEVEERNSIQFLLRDKTGNPYGVGAKMILRYGLEGELAQTREVTLSGGFASFDEPLIQFGLGVHTQVLSLGIIWPDGEETKISTPLSAGHRYEIRRQ